MNTVPTRWSTGVDYDFKQPIGIYSYTYESWCVVPEPSSYHETPTFENSRSL